MKLLLDENLSRSASLGSLLKHRAEIEDGLITHGMPYVEVLAATTK